MATRRSPEAVLPIAAALSADRIDNDERGT